ncbi:MAG: aminotransferase class I/II-fold pyridoxal phosphate-dependent enzyme, partial [Ottowia sp.]|nr:aminotransferase class I/II-fold pyridoxal phosphate-dependent enzyme [Ottowia sp.]
MKTTAQACAFETLCQIPLGKHSDPHGAISTPIYQSATFAHRSVAQPGDFDYSRVQNPTREQLEATVCALEGGAGSIAFASGMAAIAALMELFQPGAHLIVDADLYGGTTRLFNAISVKNGLQFTPLDCSSEDIAPHITQATKAVFIETPTNPMMRVSDIARLAEVAHAHGLLLIVDNTFLSPYLQNPLALGADIVVHSATKYLGGHNDTLGGLLVCRSAEIAEKLRFILKTTGAALAPFDSWLILRGIKTLPVRMQRAQENAHALAEFLHTLPQVARVIYPGLPQHPGHALLQRQARGAGAMLAFETDTPQRARAALERVRIIRFTESLG